MRPMRRTHLLRAARLALGLLLLLLLFLRADLGEVKELLRSGDRRVLALGFALLFVANPGLQTMRLHVLVARYTRSVATTLKLYLIGALFNLTLPSNVGGDAVKLVYLRRMNAENWAAPFALLMLHRVTGMLSLLLAAAVYAGFEHERFGAMLRRAQVEAQLPLDGRLLAIGAAGLIVLGAAWLLLSRGFRQKLLAKVVRFGKDGAAALARIGPGPTLGLLSFTALFHVVRVLGFCTLVAFSGSHIAFGDSLIVLAATAVAGVIPITVGGLGVMEHAVSWTLLLYGVPDNAGLIVGLVNRVVLLLGAALGGVVFLRFGAPTPPEVASQTTPQPPDAD